MVRLQSAMEYLMTYGWAILAIAIVMVSLYSLGIFNTGNLKPTVTPGSCQVLKTATQSSLAGQCTDLQPKYVARFNGQSSHISETHYLSPTQLAATGITISAWIRTTAATANAIAGQEVDGCNYYCDGGIELGYSATGKVSMVMYNNSAYNGATSVTSVNTGQWYHVVGVYNSTYLVIYVNGVKEAAKYNGNVYGVSPTGTIIGAQGLTYPAKTFYFNGSIANVQLYNTSLDSATVQALYNEGIGGAPIDLRHLLAWWPLNGDANDYSGNNRNAAPSDVIWNANWQST